MNATATGGVPLRIDFVSDVVCPWCAIGLASLERALERMQGEIQAELHFRPFELNPQLPPEGEDIAEHLQTKYGLSPAQLAEGHERIRQRGAELGFTFAADRRRIYNTFDAHRLLYWARLEGSQVALKHALLRAYFTDGRDVSDHDTLVHIAGMAGLAPDRAHDILASDAYAAEVRAEQQLYSRKGINAVPAVIIEQRDLISGGQPIEVFERALRQIAERKTG
ncbi:DsbA family oxidoreductase [Luteimonas suaedae]|uniref:DsbA family oxidoreductase n=1 Tax=Luteimonas suaedae TaxID=2605430 RepID=UPI0011EF7AFA|nr:DsbA family oxidoreductase [Luteimonas suaedae]